MIMMPNSDDIYQVKKKMQKILKNLSLNKLGIMSNTNVCELLFKYFKNRLPTSKEIMKKLNYFYMISTLKRSIIAYVCFGFIKIIKNNLKSILAVRYCFSH